MRDAGCRSQAASDRMTTAYARVLGAQITRLCPELQALHCAHGRFQGRITVSLSQNPLLRFGAGIAGFPRATVDAPFVFSTQSDGSCDIWVRQIGSTTMASRLWVTDDGLLAEKMGTATAISALHVTSDGGLVMQLKRFRVLGGPVPLTVAPKVSATESGQGGYYRFDVAIGVPVFGVNLVRYAGQLAI